MNKKALTRLALSILFCQAAGIVGGIFTASSVTTWYTTLNKPSFNPPGWLFGPVWLTLYTMMGVALFMVWQKGIKKNRVAFQLFIVHLFVNTAWSIVFFGLQSPLFGLVVIAVLWQMIAWLIYEFYHIRKASALLLIPYFLWVSFATVLNYFLWKLN